MRPIMDMAASINLWLILTLLDVGFSDPLRRTASSKGMRTRMCVVPPGRTSPLAPLSVIVTLTARSSVRRLAILATLLSQPAAHVDASMYVQIISSVQSVHLRSTPRPFAYRPVGSVTVIATAAKEKPVDCISWAHTPLTIRTNRHFFCQTRSPANNILSPLRELLRSLHFQNGRII